MTAAAASPGAADLLRSIGLLADGPVRWGLPVPARGPGLYVVELGAPVAAAPLELARVGKWLEKLPELRLDGSRPTSKGLAARLASLWWPDSPVLYAGSTDRSTGGRVAALVAHVPGDRQPHADGQWLHLLPGLDRLGARIWWAETDAPEEYLDAFFDAFAEGRRGLADRPAAALTLPWANGRRPTGERQAHGLTGQVLPAPPATPEPSRTVVELPPGAADGTELETRGTGTTRRAPSSPPLVVKPPAPAPVGRSAAAPAPTVHRAPAIARSGSGGRSGSANRPAEPVHVSQGALDRMRAELDELARVRRPEVVHRIKTAREHGDLKENAEYHAAREEQSFLEGRIQALEDRIRRAVVVAEESASGKVIVGSTVKVEVMGDEVTYTIVGSAEADPVNGKLSLASPVGSALLGATTGQEVDVRTPRGSVRYRVLSID